MSDTSTDSNLLTEHLCVFLDILGFSSLVEQIETTGSDREFIRLHEAYRTGIKLLKESREYRATPEFQWEIRAFTDNIFLAFPISSHDAEVELGFLVEDISRFQLHLAVRGYVTRGGMALGRLFVDDAMIFGPALLEALRLEKMVARDPRIVLGAGISELVQQHVGYYHPPHTALQNCNFLRDVDGRLFVNYLESAIHETAAGLQLDLNSIEAHRETIENGLREHVGRPQVWSKFRWLSAYHNWFLESAMEHGYTNEANFVHKGLASAYPRRIHRSPNDPETEQYED